MSTPERSTNKLVNESVKKTESSRLIEAICLQLLARREYSQVELLNLLLKKGFQPCAIQTVIDKLTASGWQSDQRFAENYSRYRIKKGFGPVKIDFDLRQRGIEGFDLQAVVMALATSWDELIAQVYHKKYSNPSVPDAKTWTKRSRFLLQRGFSNEMINSLLKALQ